MKTLSQKGFTLVEGLLIVVIVGILAGTGFYVYSANKKSSDALNDTNNSSVSFKKKQKEAKTEQKYLEIKELGVKLPVKSEGVSYAYAPDQGYAGLSAESFTAAVNACTSAGTPAAFAPSVIEVTKHQGTFNPNPDKQFEQLGAYSTFGKQFNGFYLSYGTPDGGICNGDQTEAASKAKQLFTKLKSELESGVKNAQQL